MARDETKRDGAPIRVLVVDDEPDLETLVRQSFRREIRAGEIEFLFAADGVDALEALERERAAGRDVTCVFTDINMPRMDGLTLLARLQELDPDLTTVVVSAYSDQRNIRTAMNSGAFDFITKPIEFADFAATIDKAARHAERIREMKSARREAERSQAQLARFFSPAIARAVAHDVSTLRPGDERREATFLFSDLADFSPLVEGVAPTTVVEMLNEYFDRAVALVFEHDGTLMQISGDSVYAAFGAPDDDARHAAKAVACSLAIDAFARGFEREWNERGVPLGRTRIGVNTGRAIVGTFGSERFFDFRALGRAVNVAARLEEANKILGTRLCVSRSTVDHIDRHAGGGFRGRPIGHLLIRGHVEPILCYEPLPGGEPTAAESRAETAYAHAYALLAAGSPDARGAFAQIVGENPADPLAVLHLSRILAGASDVTVRV